MTFVSVFRPEKPGAKHFISWWQTTSPPIQWECKKQWPHNSPWKLAKCKDHSSWRKNLKTENEKKRIIIYNFSFHSFAYQHNLSLTWAWKVKWWNKTKKMKLNNRKQKNCSSKRKASKQHCTQKKNGVRLLSNRVGIPHTQLSPNYPTIHAKFISNQTHGPHQRYMLH